MNDEIFINTDEAMRLLGCKRTTLWSCCKKGWISKTQITKRSIRYKKSEILAFLESRQVKA
ncbi:MULTISPECIES: helix-turn-helix transcriptional regulator [Campylobacter]|uniref:helix-turn-helix transcriptional regulator n=1 Tax=Campylobacter TaxID=194 RepID=UPI0014706002|nr:MULTISPECIES: helix-turn-helix domain-containing protein [Campylobacter]MBN7287570.1 helix-turn-helix domain-containing protein [Campylobacter curvus]